MIKKYSLVVAVFLCFVLNGFGQTFNQITTQAALTDGQYLIVGDGMTNDGLMLNSTISAPAIDKTTITNPTSSINSGFTTNNIFSISVSGSVITIYNASVGFVSWGRTGFTGNNATFYSGTVANTEQWTASVSGGLWSLANVSLSSRILQWNDGSPRFACYTSSQVKLKLYKLAPPSTDPNLAISGTPTNHGSSCVGTPTSTVTYTITNSGTNIANGVTVVSDNPTQFVVSNLSSTTIPASGGTATYDVTFTPSSAGAKTATITVASTTTGSNAPTINLTGTGLATVNQAVSSSAATLVLATTATLNGNVTTLGTCPSTIEKGFVYSETNLNGNPSVGGANVTKTVVSGVATGTYNLGLTGLTANTQYSFKAYVYNGTTYTYSTPIRTFTTQNLVDYCNLQNPGSGTKEAGEPFNIQAQVYEAGLTDTTSGQAPGIEAWIGYRTTDATTTADFATGWTWVNAAFNVEVGNNDEYQADLGSVILTPGTYYYVSRFRIGGASAPFSYGGFSGGFWNGTTNVSGVLTITPAILDYYNLQFPQTGNILTGDSFDVYAQAYEAGVTEAAGRGNDVVAWIGYSTTNATNTGDFSSSAWTWVSAPFSSQVGNNDEFKLDLGTTIGAAGTYYYVSRFSYNSGAYTYGGFNIGGGDGAWDGTNDVSGIVTITDPPLADVVITEIMYNSVGYDDEWIEICNISGSTQNLSLYKIKVQGTTHFTFPSNTLIADGTCITVSLGSNGDNIYNNICPFTPDYGVGASTNATDILPNGNGPYNIGLFAANGTTLVDTVAYSKNDGGNGNDATLHVIDATLDNSNTNSNWQEVFYGGTPGSNFLVSPCAPTVPKLDVERNTFATIPNNSNASTGFNTLWGGVVNVGTSVNKTYYIRNEGYATLNITSIASNSADFILVGLPTFPYSMAPGDLLMFEISFSPTSTVPSPKNGVITINSNDPTLPVRTFKVKGTPGCPLYSGTMYPTSGPIGTEVTITSAQNLTGATATLNGQALTVISSSVGELIVQLPNTITTGGALVVTLSGGCTFSNTFVLIDNAISGCEGTGSAPNDIFISQVTDSGKDSFSYIELYNGTGNVINLNNYSIRIYNNGRSTIVNSTYNIDLNNVNLPSGNTYVLAIGANNMNCESEHNIPVLADQVYAVPGVSINFSNNNNNDGHDHIRLYNNTSYIDAWGTYRDESWAASLNLGGKGANFMRRTDAAVPTTFYSNNDWIIQDWGDNCSDLDYSDIGMFDFSTGALPSVSVLNPPSVGCDLTTSLTVTGTEGFAGGNPLAYQWYYSAPGDLGWTMVPDDAIYNDVTTNTLQILNTTMLDGYQYYCEVRENDATCYIASNAIKLEVAVSIWDGTAWTPAAPDSSTIAVIDGDYDMSATGANQPSFSACQLVVNSNKILTVSDNKYVEVENNVTNNGTIELSPKAAFVQRNDGAAAGTFVNNGIASVYKKTANFYNDGFNYHYTYWSSPVNNPSTPGLGQNIVTLFPNARGNRRFYFEAANFVDSYAETNNGNQTGVSGQDDIDDNMNDWQPATGNMEVGRGYAVTAVAPPGFPYTDNVLFSGSFNTGDITVPIYKNDSEINDNNWNFIGNPYPSAIDVDAFFDANVSNFPTTQPANPAEGAIFLWSQSAPPVDTNNGNEVLNFSQSDYAIINRLTETAGASGITPNRYIPSGQGFFIAFKENLSAPVTSQVTTASIVFKNSMRAVLNNGQFFRVSNSDSNAASSHRNVSSEAQILWLNLTSNNGVFNQIAIAYADQATDGDDGWSYDTPFNLSSTAAAMVYSTIAESPESKFAIQGKNSTSLNLDEIIPLGFYTSITEPTNYKISLSDVQGEFLTNNSVYLKDNAMNITFNLSEGDYVFSSTPGEFKNRFEIVFRAQSLSVVDNEITPNGLSIVELADGRVKFTVGNSLDIQAVEILDLLGRTLYNLKGNSASEVYDLSNLSQAAYMAKVTLSNGQVITKRAVKRK